MTVMLIAYALALAVFVAIDLFWLMGPGRPLYVTEIGSLLRSEPNKAAAIVFYLIYSIGLTYFAIMPGLKSGLALQALGLGALFGFVAYATYDLTNLAVVNGFTLRIAIIDMVWGSLLSAVVSWLVVRALSYFGFGA